MSEMRNIVNKIPWFLDHFDLFIFLNQDIRFIINVGTFFLSYARSKLVRFTLSNICINYNELYRKTVMCIYIYVSSL